MKKPHPTKPDRVPYAKTAALGQAVFTQPMRKQPRSNLPLTQVQVAPGANTTPPVSDRNMAPNGKGRLFQFFDVGVGIVAHVVDDAGQAVLFVEDIGGSHLLTSSEHFLFTSWAIVFTHNTITVPDGFAVDPVFDPI